MINDLRAQIVNLLSGAKDRNLPYRIDIKGFLLRI